MKRIKMVNKPNLIFLVLFSFVPMKYGICKEKGPNCDEFLHDWKKKWMDAIPECSTRDTLKYMKCLMSCSGDTSVFIPKNSVYFNRILFYLYLKSDKIDYIPAVSVQVAAIYTIHVLYFSKKNFDDFFWIYNTAENWGTTNLDVRKNLSTGDFYTIESRKKEVDEILQLYKEWMKRISKCGLEKARKRAKLGLAAEGEGDQEAD